MFEGVLNTSVFRLHLVMFCFIIANIWLNFRIPKWLDRNLPSFKYFRKITLTACCRKARRGRDSLPSCLLIWYNTHAHWRTTSTIQTNENHHHFVICIPILGHILVHIVDKIHVLVVTVELIGCLVWLIGCCSWIYFLLTLFQHRTNLLGSQDSEEAT